MRTVFVTGATGVIGSALVPILLEEEGTTVRLLLRAKSDADLDKRLSSLFSFWELDPEDARYAGRVTALRGDVCEPQLGLTESDWNQLAAATTNILHAAGNVKLNQSLDDARRNAVTSAENIITLAKACRQQGPFEKLDFVSTLGVAGRMHGLIPERRLHEARTFHNTYEQTKAEAEELLFRELDAGLAATIHRPSMVVGDSRTGKVIHFQVFYYLTHFLSGQRTFGFIPDPGTVTLDLIPSDYVARGIQIASRSPESAGKVLHLCTGPARSLSVLEIARRLHQALDEAGERPRPLRVVRPAWFRALIPVVSRLLPAKPRRALQSLPFFLDYLAEDQTFGNAETTAFLQQHQLSLPAPAEYLPVILAYYHRQRAGKAS